LNHLGDTAAHRLKNRKNRLFEPTPVSEIALAGQRLLKGACCLAGAFANFLTSHTSPEACIMGLSDAEEIRTLAVSVLIQYRL